MNSVNLRLIVLFFILLFGSFLQAQQLNETLNQAMQSVKNSLKDIVEATAAEIDSDANIALGLLSTEIDDSTIYIDQAYGYLIFPRVVKVGMGVGIETGEGVLRVAGSSVDYYRNTKPFWHFARRPDGRTAHKLDYDKWIQYLGTFGGKYWKPSIGCAACFFIKEIYDPPEIWLAGFDSHFGHLNKYDSVRLGSVHDFDAEKRCIHSLFKVNYLGIEQLRKLKDSNN